jgi:hypothetical protein
MNLREATVMVRDLTVALATAEAELERVREFIAAFDANDLDRAMQILASIRGRLGTHAD